MKYKIGDKVRIQQPIDETGDKKYTNYIGIIKHINIDGKSGSTEDMPLYDVSIPLLNRSGSGEFWTEELNPYEPTYIPAYRSSYPQNYSNSLDYTGVEKEDYISTLPAESKEHPSYPGKKASLLVGEGLYVQLKDNIKDKYSKYRENND